MNLKQLIQFGLENSQEPVIKNPVLRAALEGPRTMVGTPTKEVTQYGRRIYDTPGGEQVSEKSTTFFLNGKWLNVPSIHEGRAFTDDQLRGMIKRDEIEPTSEHGSRIEAEEAAASRSNMMKSHTKGFDQGGRIIGKPGGLVEPGVEYYATEKWTREQKELRQEANRRGLIYDRETKEFRPKKIAIQPKGKKSGPKLEAPKGKVTQKQLIEMLGEEYNAKMARGKLTGRPHGKKNYVANKVSELLNATEAKHGKFSYYLFDKPNETMLDFIRSYIDAPHLMDRTVDNMKILDKEFGSMLQNAKGKGFFRDKLTVDMAKEALTNAGVKNITDSKAALAMTRLGQSYQDKLFKNVSGIKENKKVGNFIFDSFNELDQWHPWRQATYGAALSDIKHALGNKAGNLSGFKTSFKELMQKRYEHRDFVFNEVFSISTSANRGSYPYAYFVDLTESNMNSKALSSFQGRAGIVERRIQDAIEKYRKTGNVKHYNEAVKIKDMFNNQIRKDFLSSEKVLQYQKDFGIKPNALKIEIGSQNQVKNKINFAKNYHENKNLQKWKSLGIDIDAHTGQSGYVKTFGKKSLPKNVVVASELFTEDTRFGKGKKIFDEKALNKFLKNNPVFDEKKLNKLIKTAKTAKGPAKFKAIQAIIATVGMGAAASLFDKFGIRPAMADTAVAAPGVTGGDIGLGALATAVPKKGRKLWGKALSGASKILSTTPGFLGLEAFVGPGFVSSAGGSFSEAIASPLLLEGTMRNRRIYNKLKDIGLDTKNIEIVKESLMLDADPFMSSMMPVSKEAINPEVRTLASQAYDWASGEIAKEDEARLERADKFDYLQDVGFAGGGLANLTTTVAPDSEGIMSLKKK